MDQRIEIFFSNIERYSNVIKTLNYKKQLIETVAPLFGCTPRDIDKKNPGSVPEYMSCI